MLTRVLRLFKKYFIPHKHNNHKPHLLRWEGALAVISIALLAEIAFLSYAFFILPGINFLAAILPGVIVEETNASRAAYTLSQLSVNAALTEAAERKAEDMAEKGYFAHFGPDGKSPWAWMREAAYSFEYAGENLAINFVDSKDVVEAWMNSLSHRENILNGEFTEIGIGMAHGTYQGSDAVFVVEMFGRPLRAGVALMDESKDKPAVAAANTVSKAEKPASSSSPAASSSFVAFRQNSNFFAKAAANPIQAAHIFYLALITAVSLALLLTIFVKIRLQHPRLIVNGVTMLLILSSIMLLNQYIAFASAQIL